MSQWKTKVAVAALTLSLAGVGLIQRFEGTEQEAYLDAVGVPTVCTGSTRNVYLGMHVQPGECEQRLTEDTTYAGAAVRRCVHQKLTQEQYDALVSFTFNVGGGALCKSTLVRKLNAGECVQAAKEFPRWNRAGGRVLPGLTHRRVAEMKLFLTGCTENDSYPY